MTAFVLIAEVCDDQRVVCYADNPASANALLVHAVADFTAIEAALAGPRDRLDTARRATRDNTLPEAYPGSGGPSRPPNHPSWADLVAAHQRFNAEYDNIMQAALDPRAFARESYRSERPEYRIEAIRRWSPPELS